MWIHCAKIMTSLFRKAVTESSFRWLGCIKQDYGADWATKLVQSETACDCPKSSEEEQNAKQQKEYDTEPAHVILYTSSQLNSIFEEKIQQYEKKKVPEEMMEIIDDTEDGMMSIDTTDDEDGWQVSLPEVALVAPEPEPEYWL